MAQYVGDQICHFKQFAAHFLQAIQKLITAESWVGPVNKTHQQDKGGHAMPQRKADNAQKQL